MVKENPSAILPPRVDICTTIYTSGKSHENIVALVNELGFFLAKFKDMMNVEELLCIACCALVCQGYGLSKPIGSTTLCLPKELCIVGTIRVASIINALQLEKVRKLGYNPLVNSPFDEVCVSMTDVLNGIVWVYGNRFKSLLVAIVIPHEEVPIKWEYYSMISVIGQFYTCDKKSYDHRVVCWGFLIKPSTPTPCGIMIFEIKARDYFTWVVLVVTLLIRIGLLYCCYTCGEFGIKQWTILATHSEKWDPAGNDHFFFTKGSLQFKQWDPGGFSFDCWEGPLELRPLGGMLLTPNNIVLVSTLRTRLILMGEVM